MTKPSTKKKPAKKPYRRPIKKVIDLQPITLAKGRPSSYREEYATQAHKLCQLGATDRDLAEFFEVSVTTIWSWQGRHPEFSVALNRAKDAADDRVERSLYARATGYTYESEKIFNNEGEIIRVPVIEHVPPDVTACIFWLKNRRSSEWRDKTDHEHNHMHALKLQGGTMSVEDAQSMFREARNMTPAEIMKTIEGKRTA